MQSEINGLFEDILYALVLIRGQLSLPYIYTWRTVDMIHYQEIKGDSVPVPSMKIILG